MTTHTSRRALRLATMLVAAGLSLTAAPHAALADGTDASSGMRLTSAQADDLASRVQTDVYGDGALAADTEKTEGPGTDASAASAASAEGTASDGTSSGATTAASSITVTKKSSIEGVRGTAVTLPAGGAKGDHFTLHSLAHVARSSADGTTRWDRDGASLMADWGVRTLRPWDTELYPARVLMGYNAVTAFSPTNGQGYDTGDLTGDGVPDVALSASVGVVPAIGVRLPGTTRTSGTIVSVLDGATGKTLYSKVYAYASTIKIVGDVLIVGDEPWEATTTGKLTGTRFTYADGKLTEAGSWTHDTGDTGAANWGAAQDLGDGRIAVSWNLRKTSASPGRGRTLVLDTNDGSVVWQTDSPLYGRQLGLDSRRGRLVAVEQSDSGDGVRYEVAAYDLGDGTRTTLDSRVNVLPTAFTVGDLTGSPDAEYVVGESSLTEYRRVNANTIRVLDGADAATPLWQYTTKRAAANDQDGPSTWNLAVTDRSLVASGQDDTEIGRAANTGGRYASLTVFSGRGKVRWQTKGATASPYFQEVFKDGDGRHVRIVDSDQNVRTYDFADGTQERLTPLQADMAFAQLVDVDGDRKADLVEAGQSHGVWAYRGTSLLDGTPQKLWQTTVPGSVHRMRAADVTGDETPEIIVAADSAVVVLDSKTGSVLSTIDGGGQYVRSVSVADVDGDGKEDVLVPTDALRVYRGDGTPLWSYAAPADAGKVYFSDPSVNDRKVYVQYTSADSLMADAPAMKALQLDAKTGAFGWEMTPKAPANALGGKLHGGILDNAVHASPNIPYADGHAVAYTWVAWTPSGIGGADAFGPANIMEIRDGRTGELLHTSETGGLWTHTNYLDGDQVLMAGGASSVRSYGADGQDTAVFLSPPTHGMNWLTAPGGRKVGATGGTGGVYLWDPAVLSGEIPYPDYIGRAPSEGGADNMINGDLDGDGVDEVVELNYDHRGVNQTAELLGGGFLVTNNSKHNTVTLKLS
ncbi:FG-GAP repeat domain-containing protein [Streptomyces sp. NPDC014773]|uniref:FG-GAP repeat domain-containing protein n=1 Tax=Streptomyces sp. NPDC014773 TaxID=3364908 RepID=UPI0036FE803E